MEDDNKIIDGDISVQIGVLNTHLKYIKDQNDEIKKTVEELRKVGVTKSEVREIKSDVSSVETRVRVLEKRQAVFDDSFLNKLGKGWEAALITAIVSSLIFILIQGQNNSQDISHTREQIKERAK